MFKYARKKESKKEKLQILKYNQLSSNDVTSEKHNVSDEITNVLYGCNGVNLSINV